MLKNYLKISCKSAIIDKIIASPNVRLARLHQLHAYALLILPIMWVIAIYPRNWQTNLSNVLIFTIGGIVMRSAGCIINDLWDRKIDAQVARTKNRPLASGELSVRQAVHMLIPLLLIALGLLFMLSPQAIVVGLVAILLTMIYPLAKRFTSFAQVILGFTFNIGMLMVRLTVSDTIGFVPLLLYFAAVIWTIAYDTIYGCQDLIDDEKIGVKSTSLVFGDKVPQMVWNMYKITGFIIAIAAFKAGLHLIFFAFLALAVYLLYVQTERVNISNAESCRETFNSNVLFALIVLIGIIIG